MFYITSFKICKYIKKLRRIEQPDQIVQAENDIGKKRAEFKLGWHGTLYYPNSDFREKVREESKRKQHEACS